MQPINLITQNEYLDYQRSVNNINNYYQFGLRALVYDNDNLIHNPDYTLIQVIQELIVKIFSDAFNHEMLRKQITLQNDFVTVNFVHERFRGFHRDHLNPIDYPLYDLFFTTVIAGQLIDDKIYQNWNQPKGFKGYMRDVVDGWMGCRVAFSTGIVGPYQNRQFVSSIPEKIDELAALPKNNVPELVNFLLNKFEYADPVDVDFYLQAIRRDYPGPQIVLRYGKAICSYMQRRRDIFSTTSDEIRIKFLKHALFAIEESWNDDTSIESLNQTLLFYHVSPKAKLEALELYRKFVERMSEKLPEQAEALNDFVVHKLN